MLVVVVVVVLLLLLLLLAFKGIVVVAKHIILGQACPVWAHVTWKRQWNWGWVLGQKVWNRVVVQDGQVQIKGVVGVRLVRQVNPHVHIKRRLCLCVGSVVKVAVLISTTNATGSRCRNAAAGARTCRVQQGTLLMSLMALLLLLLLLLLL